MLSISKSTFSQSNITVVYRVDDFVPTFFVRLLIEWYEAALVFMEAQIVSGTATISHFCSM